MVSDRQGLTFPAHRNRAGCRRSSPSKSAWPTPRVGSIASRKAHGTSEVLFEKPGELLIKGSAANCQGELGRNLPRSQCRRTYVYLFGSGHHNCSFVHKPLTFDIKLYPQV